MKAYQSLLFLILYSCVWSLTCSGNQKLVEIHRIYGLDAEKEKMEVYQGVVSTGQLIYTEIGTGKSYREIVRQLCLTDNVYSVVMTSDEKTGWHSSSRFYILVNGQEYLRGSLRGKYENTQFLYVFYSFPATQDWRTTNTAQTTPNWRQSEPTSWGAAVAPGNFANITSATTTRYYCRTVTNNNQYVALLEVAVYTRFGFIAYLGNTEIMRHYLPQSGVVAGTEPTQVDAAPSYKKVLLSGSQVLFGKPSLTLGVEVHTGGQAVNEKDDFKVVARLIIDTPSTRLYDVDIKSSPEPSQPEIYANLLDPSTETTFGVSSNRCNITFSFKNSRSELIHSYTIRSARNRPAGDPSAWALYGTNYIEEIEDSTVWTYLDSREKEVFADRNVVKKYVFMNNINSFKHYRLVIESLADDSSTLQIGQIEFFAESGNTYGASLAYPSGNLQYYMNIDPSVYIAPTVSGYTNFRVTGSDALPDGITLDPRNGVISGVIPQDGENSNHIYRISANPISGTNDVNADVRISISKCQRTENIKVLLRYINKPGNFRDYVVLYRDGGMGNTIATIRGSNKVETVERVFCLSNSATYRFALRTTNKNAWTTGTYIEVELFYHISKSMKLGRYTLFGSTRQNVYFPTVFSLPDTSTNVYSIYSSESVTEPPMDWFSASSMTTGWTTFDTTNWESAPPVHRKVWFIRRSFSLAAVGASVQSYEMQFFCRQGVVVYINGNEKYRLNVESGPVTSTSEITGGSSISSWHTLTGLKSDFQTGSNLIAFAIVNTNAELLIDFNVVLMFNTVANTVSRSFDTIATGSNIRPGYVANNLVDNQVQTMSVIDRLTSDATGVYDLKFKNNRYELINYYCFTSNSEFPHHDPIDWDIFGSNDGTGDHNDVNSQWIYLKNQTMYDWSYRNQRACFYIHGNTNAFNIYRFVLNENSYQLPTNAFALAEIELYTMSYPTYEASITLQPATQRSYMNGRVIPVIPSQSYYRHCSVSPDLPHGVTINRYNGIVSGTPIELIASTTFTVTCENPLNQVRTGTFTMEIIKCNEDEGRDLFSLVYPNTQGQGEYMGYTFSNGPTQYATRTALPNYSAHELSLCMLTNSSFSMTFSSTSGGYGINYASILLSDNSEYFRVGVAANANVEVNSVSPYVLIKNSAYWNYLYEGEVPNDWTTNISASSNWNYNSTLNMPVPTSITQYYVMNFRLRGRTVTGEVEYTIRVKAGAIVYLNGIVIAQINMPGTSVTNETLATTEYSMPRTFRGSYKTVGVVNDVNVLAVEMHRTSVIPTSRIFQMTLMFVHEFIPRQYRGIASASDMTSDESYENAFDNNPNTVYRSEKPCSSQYLRYDFTDGSKYFINSYRLTVDSTCMNIVPVTWVLEGSENGNDWVVLDAQMNYNWTGGQTMREATIEFNNPSTYSSYRIRFSTCSGGTVDESVCPTEGIQIVDWNLYNSRPNQVNECAATEGYPAAYRNLYSYRTCPAMYTGFSRRQCQNNGSFATAQNYCRVAPPSSFTYPHTEYEFLVNHNLTSTVSPTVVCASCTFTSLPPFPQGLLLNESTGTITGEPTEAASGEYVITAMNVAGETTITLSITTGEGPLHCPTDELGGWERSVAGQNATKPCPTGYTGVLTRFCRDGSPAVWEPESNECFATTPTVSYPNATYDFVKHVQISTIIPTITGVAIISRKINPTLPSGLYFDPSSGIISGKPTIKISTTEYTVSIQNSYATATTTFTITITSLWCNADGDWGQTDSGDTYFKNCPANKEGTWSRMCSTEQPPYWKTVVDACVYIMPTLTYAKSAYQLQRGMSVNIVPTKGYYITSITYSGTLPSGLSFNNGDGSITGNPPSLADASTLTITVRNPDKVNVVYLSLSVVSIKCTSDGTWPMTEAGQTAQLSCAALKEGLLYRECTLSGDQGVWAAVTGACTFIKPVVTYPTTTMEFVKGKSTYYRPNVENQIDSFSITPSLPEGLTFSTTNGEISGTAKGPKGSQTYKVKASNADGYKEVDVTINIIVYACEADAMFKETEQATTGYAWCRDGKVGVISRPCNKGTSDSLSVWGTADSSMCMSDPTKMRPSEGRRYNRFTAVISGITKASFTEIEYAELTNIFVAGTESVKSELFIESYTEGDVVIAAAGMQLQTRIETQEANAEAKKLKVKEFFSGSACTNKLKESKVTTLNSLKCGISGDVAIVGPAVNSALTILIVVVVIFLVLFILLVVYYFFVRSKSKDNKHGRTLHQSRVGTRGGLSSQHEDDIEEGHGSHSSRKSERACASSAAAAASSSKKSRYQDEDEEEEEAPRPKKKQQQNERSGGGSSGGKKKPKYQDEDEEEESYSKPTRRKK